MKAPARKSKIVENKKVPQKVVVAPVMAFTAVQPQAPLSVSPEEIVREAQKAVAQNQLTPALKAVIAKYNAYRQ